MEEAWSAELIFSPMINMCCLRDLGDVLKDNLRALDRGDGEVGEDGLKEFSDEQWSAIMTLTARGHHTWDFHNKAEILKYVEQKRGEYEECELYTHDNLNILKMIDFETVAEETFCFKSPMIVAELLDAKKYFTRAVNAVVTSDKDHPEWNPALIFTEYTPLLISINGVDIKNNNHFDKTAIYKYVKTKRTLFEQGYEISCYDHADLNTFDMICPEVVIDECKTREHFIKAVDCVVGVDINCPSVIQFLTYDI